LPWLVCEIRLDKDKFEHTFAGEFVSREEAANAVAILEA